MQNRMKHTLSALALISTGTLLTACGGSSSTDSVSSVSVSIPFQAVAGDQTIKCGETITGLGTGSSSETGVGTDAKIYNFRMFVHDITLITDQGIEIPAVLDEAQDGQNADVALLDFRDTADIDDVSTEICPQTTSDTTSVNPNYKDTITASVTIDPAYTISHVQFTLGVPFNLNHDDPSAADEPLRSPGLATGMTWNWQGGYKFVGFDVRPVGGITRPSDDTFTSNQWNIHLGSTGCEVDPTDGSEATECLAPNRPTITLPIGSVALDDIAIQVDYAALVADSNLSQDEGVKVGCMSFTGDPECEEIFEKFGLPWGDNEAVEQTVFSVVDGSIN